METKNKIMQFLVVTFILSLALAALLYKFATGDYSNKILTTVLAICYMFIPALSTVIVKKWIHREKLCELPLSLKINRWFFISWLLTPIIVLLATGISILFPGVTYSPEMTGLLTRLESLESVITPEQLAQAKEALSNSVMNPFLMLAQGLIAGITVNAIAAFGEEFGWRGFLLHEFKEMSFLKAATVIGFIWGIWHTPLILMGHNYPQHPEIGVFMMVVFSILLSAPLIYVTLKAKSVIAAAIMHGTMNGTAGFSIIMIDGGSDITTGIAGFAGFMAIFIFSLFLFAYDFFISKEKIFLSKIGTHLPD